jgi:hypothetical protein
MGRRKSTGPAKRVEAPASTEPSASAEERALPLPCSAASRGVRRLVRRYMRRAFAVAFRPSAIGTPKTWCRTLSAKLEQIHTYDAAPICTWFSVCSRTGAQRSRSRSIRHGRDLDDEPQDASADVSSSAPRCGNASPRRWPSSSGSVDRDDGRGGWIVERDCRDAEISPGTVRWYLHEARHRLRTAPHHCMRGTVMIDEEIGEGIRVRPMLRCRGEIPSRGQLGRADRRIRARSAALLERPAPQLWAHAAGRAHSCLAVAASVAAIAFGSVASRT